MAQLDPQRRKDEVGPALIAPRPIRIGSVPYLNSKVLVYGLAPRTPEYSLEFHPPSLLARKLREGEIDIGLVSSIEYFRNPDYLMLPGLGICGLDTMWSIRLFRRKSVRALRRVGMDPDSETTNALLELILLERMGLDCDLIPLERGEDPGGRGDLDGFLKIGDPCLAFDATGLEATDLLAEWHAWTGLPFVFAAWLTPKDKGLGHMEEQLRQAKRIGFEHTADIAEEYHRAIGIPVDRARDYVSTIIRYELGAREVEALDRFQELLAKRGLISKVRPLEFYSPPVGSR